MKVKNLFNLPFILLVSTIALVYLVLNRPVPQVLSSEEKSRAQEIQEKIRVAESGSIVYYRSEKHRDPRSAVIVKDSAGKYIRFSETRKIPTSLFTNGEAGAWRIHDLEFESVEQPYSGFY